MPPKVFATTYTYAHMSNQKLYHVHLRSYSELIIWVSVIRWCWFLQYKWVKNMNKLKEQNIDAVRKKRNILKKVLHNTWTCCQEKIRVLLWTEIETCPVYCYCLDAPPVASQLGFRGPRPHMSSLVAYLLSTCLLACLTGVWVLNFATVLWRFYKVETDHQNLRLW